MNFYYWKIALAICVAAIINVAALPAPRSIVRRHEIRGPIVGHYHVAGTDLEVAVTKEMIGKVFATNYNAEQKHVAKRMGDAGAANKQHLKHKSMAHRKGCFGFLPPYDDPSGPIQHIKNFEKFVGVNAMAIAHDVLGAIHDRLGLLLPQMPPQ